MRSPGWVAATIVGGWLVSMLGYTLIGAAAAAQTAVPMGDAADSSRAVVLGCAAGAYFSSLKAELGEGAIGVLE